MLRNPYSSIFMFVLCLFVGCKRAASPYFRLSCERDSKTFTSGPYNQSQQILNIRHPDVMVSIYSLGELEFLSRHNNINTRVAAIRALGLTKNKLGYTTYIDLLERWQFTCKVGCGHGAWNG